MPSSLVRRAVVLGSHRVPGLRRLPMLKLLAVAEVMLLARDHATMLEPQERRRVLELVRTGRGRTRNLTEEQRSELAALLEKAQARLFLGSAAGSLSPIPLPRRIVRGRTRS